MRNNIYIVSMLRKQEDTSRRQRSTLVGGNTRKNRHENGPSDLVTRREPVSHLTPQDLANKENTCLEDEATAELETESGFLG